MVIDHKFYLNLALQEGWKYQGLTYPNPAVGSLFLDKNQKILAISAHKKSGFAHSEVETLKEAFIAFFPNKDLVAKLVTITDSEQIHNFLLANHRDFFKDGIIYVTLEPCNHYGKTPPCAKLISELNIKTVVYGSSDNGKNSFGGGDFLRSCGVNVIGGLLKESCDQLLEPFTLWNKKRFVFFKWAQTQNGVISDGKISCDESFVDVHKLREKIDLLVAGGSTVRKDRPTLDTRLVNGKNPDILIYSKQKNFDLTIPLFDIKNRKVFIESDFKILNNYKFIMIEGGPKMLEMCKELIDWYLLYQAPFSKEGVVMSAKKFKYLNSQNIGKDLKIWGKAES